MLAGALLAARRRGPTRVTRRRPGCAATRSWPLLFALGLMAKPMLVTLPVAAAAARLLAPRRGSRDRRADSSRWRARSGRCFAPRRRERRADRSPRSAALGAIRDLGALPAGERLANALVAYVRYLGKASGAAGPVDLSTLPPADGYPRGPLAAALLLARTRRRRRRGAAAAQPFLAVGWGWFVADAPPGDRPRPGRRAGDRGPLHLPAADRPVRRRRLVRRGRRPRAAARTGARRRRARRRRGARRALPQRGRALAGRRDAVRAGRGRRARQLPREAEPRGRLLRARARARGPGPFRGRRAAPASGPRPLPPHGPGPLRARTPPGSDAGLRDGDRALAGGPGAACRLRPEPPGGGGPRRRGPAVRGGGRDRPRHGRGAPPARHGIGNPRALRRGGRGVRAGDTPQPPRRRSLVQLGGGAAEPGAKRGSRRALHSSTRRGPPPRDRAGCAARTECALSAAARERPRRAPPTPASGGRSPRRC